MAGNYTYTNVKDKGLLQIHGPRLSIIGDGAAASPGVLLVDGIPVANKRSGPNSLKLVAAGAAAATTGSGGIAFTGVKVGDSVEMVINLTTPADATSSFESTISAAGYIQQTSSSSLTGSTYLFLVQPQAS
jgi:hypothetical protein